MVNGVATSSTRRPASGQVSREREEFTHYKYNLIKLGIFGRQGRSPQREIPPHKSI